MLAGELRHLGPTSDSALFEDRRDIGICDEFLEALFIPVESNPDPNSVLQQFVQPFAMGAALGIHPLAVLIVTIAGGALFGTVGLILAAPLTSAVVRISSDLTSARAETEPKPGAPGPEVAAAET
ncbi:MAG TPA: AI-2E family transporter [Solirubrobacterales bacterium]